MRDVVIFVPPGATFAGDVGAAKDMLHGLEHIQSGWPSTGCGDNLSPSTSSATIPRRSGTSLQRGHRMLKQLAAFFAILLVFSAAFILAEKQFSPFFQSCVSQESEGQQTAKEGNGSLGAVT